MKVRELIQRLSKHDPDAQVMIMDGFNGGGHPRDLNLGPVAHDIDVLDCEGSGDCEGRESEKVVVIGFGCY